MRAIAFRRVRRHCTLLGHAIWTKSPRHVLLVRQRDARQLRAEGAGNTSAHKRIAVVVTVVRRRQR